MKRLIAILLVLMLSCSVAAAEVTSKKLDVKDASLLGALNLLVVEDENRNERLADTDLNYLSDGYDSISYDTLSGAIKVKLEGDNGFYRHGTIGVDGKLLVPVQYDDVELLSDRWTAGIKLTETTGESYDYESMFSKEKKYFLIDTVDIWYKDTNLGTLTRSDYKTASAYGDYLCIRNRNDEYTFYNKAFEKSPAEIRFSQEYEEKSGAVTHMGSGTPAFCAESTLTKDEVRQSVYALNKKLVDLQGNELADLAGYSLTTTYPSGMTKTKDDAGKVGLLDASGREVFPCKYDEIGFDLDNALRTGWLDVVSDGKIGFVSLKDGSESGFVFQKDAAKLRGYFFQIEDPKEGKILFSCAGEIPTRFAEAAPAYYAPYAIVKATADSKYTVIDLKGEEVIPDMPEVNGDYNITFSNDGSLILICDKDRNYILYTVTE